MPARNRRTDATQSEAVATATATGPAVLDDETRALLDGVYGHAATCGRLDCGHLYRGPSKAVREAVILYTAEGMGMTVDLNRVSNATAAVVGALRTSQHARPVYVRQGRRNVQQANGVTLVMPEPWAIRMTPQRIEVFSSLLVGHSIVATAERQSRTVETVKSHAGYLRRETGAHDAPSALLALVAAGRLSHRAITVPESVTIAPPVAAIPAAVQDETPDTDGTPSASA
jgi:hypothetical protein